MIILQTNDQMHPSDHILFEIHKIDSPDEQSDMWYIHASAIVSFRHQYLI